jgi:aspartyl-tRNA synthetase
MVEIEELGDWFRTHYSRAITPELDGKGVVVAGWIRAIRQVGKITFLQLADREGYVQITARADEIPAELMKKISELGREYVIAARATVRANPEAPRGVELIPREIRVLNVSEAPLPLEIVTKKTPAELPTRLDWRFLDLRKPEVAAIFDISDTIKASFFEYFDKLGFINVNVPVIIGAASEGGAELFPVAYFDREAYLNQSPQLYKQILMAAGFDRVTIVTPVFRAEPHDTYRHLNELISMDIEVSFIRNEEDVIKYLDGYIPFAIRKINERCADQLKMLNISLRPPTSPLKRLTYTEALKLLKKDGISLTWGADLTPEAERALCQHFDPVVITKWPTEIRAFYNMPEPGNPKIQRSFDVLLGGLEIVTGAQRIHDYGQMLETMKARNIDPAGFKFYLDAFRYGLPPHGGFGLGLERFVMAILRLSNIREATLFPRFKGRIAP